MTMPAGPATRQNTLTRVRLGAVLALGMVAMTCRAEPSTSDIRATNARVTTTDSPAARNASVSSLIVGQQVTTAARSRARAVVDMVTGSPRGFLPGLRAKSIQRPAVRVSPSDSRIIECIGCDIAPRKPVLLVMLDTTRIDHLSAFGYHRETTPNLEKLAEESVRFRRFYANAPWTRPSVASMMTSRHRHEHGVEVKRAALRSREHTLAEAFARSGYTTGAVVGNPTVSAKRKFDQGFGHYEDVGDELELFVHAREVVDRSIAWLESVENDNWFLWTFLFDAHHPYEPDPEFDLWPNEYQGKMWSPRREYIDMPPPEYVERMISLYDAEIRQMDHHLGRLFAYLRDKGVWDDLTIVVVADHGELFGNHNCFRHSYHMWEGNIRVPLMIKTPWLRNVEGYVEDRVFSGVDLMPTLVDLHDLDVPSSWEPSGISIAEVLTGSITANRDLIALAEIRSHGIDRTMVVGPRYKFVAFEPTDTYTLQKSWPDRWDKLPTLQNDTREEYLYDLAEDPTEDINLLNADNVPADRAAALAAVADQLEDAPFDDDDEDDSDTLTEEEEFETLRSLGYVE